MDKINKRKLEVDWMRQMNLINNSLHKCTHIETCLYNSACDNSLHLSIYRPKPVSVKNNRNCLVKY